MGNRMGSHLYEATMIEIDDCEDHWQEEQASFLGPLAQRND
jgi:hypothetical protein